MLIDHFLKLADGQTLTAAAASENVVDLGQEKPTPGMNRRLTAVVQVMEDVTGKLQFSIQTSDTENGTYKDLVKDEEITAPKAGTQRHLVVPSHAKRFVRIYFGGAPTAGKVRAFLTTGVDDWFAAEEP